MNRKRRGIAPVLATIILLVVTLSVALGEAVITPNQGSIMPMAHAIEEDLVKNVGDQVHFKVKIKNTGSVGTGYLVVAMWSEHNTGEWDEARIEDMWLEPDQHEHIEMGSIEVDEWMAGKYFDVQFLLYDAHTEKLLDHIALESAWYVSEPIIAGSIIGNWVY